MEGILLSCDRRMFRYMAEVNWRDDMRSAEVARRCGVRELGDVLRVRRFVVVCSSGEKGGDDELGKDSACCGAGAVAT